MTGHQINSLVGDLVAMAKAMEELPEVRADLEASRQANGGLHDKVMALETKLMDAKNLEETLRQSIRDLEVARDDAELRFLEAEEQHGKIANAFQVALEAMDYADKIIARAHDALHPLPPMPEPTPTISEVKPIAVDPTVGSQESHSALTATDTEPVEHGQSQQPTAYPDEHSRGQSDPLPTPAPADPTGAGTESVASSSDPEPEKRDFYGFVRPEWYAWQERQPAPDTQGF